MDREAALGSPHVLAGPIEALVETVLESLGSPPASSLAEALEADRLGRDAAAKALERQGS